MKALFCLLLVGCGGMVDPGPTCPAPATCQVGSICEQEDGTVWEVTPTVSLHRTSNADGWRIIAVCR